MLAAYFTGQKKFDIREVPKPTPPADGLLVKVHACAICGTDLKIMNQADVKMKKGKKRSMSLPRVTGHEFSAIVEEVGKETQGFTPGEKVVIAPTVPCMRCSMCNKGFFEMCDNLYVVSYDCDGGFEEYCLIERKIIDGNCVLKVDNTTDLDPFSMAEPLSCAIHCFYSSPVKEGDTVVVIGSGPLGCFITELAKIYGAGKTILTGRSREKLNQARICNPDVIIHGSGEALIQRIRDITNGDGADLVVIACSTPIAQQDAFSIIAKKGTINIFSGLPRNNSVVSIDTNIVHYNEITLIGTHGSRPEQVKEAIELIKNKCIDMNKYITHRFPLKDINIAFKQAFSRNRLKIIIKP